MRKAIAVVTVFAFVMLGATSLYALPEAIGKFTKGAGDILTAPLELPKYIHKDLKESSFKPMGLLGGIIKGTAHAIKKVGSGVVDVVTFPVKLDK